VDRTQRAAVAPIFDLAFEGKDGTNLAVNMAMYGQMFALLPTLDSTHLATEINGNLLPGVEAVIGVIEMRWWICCGINAHRGGRKFNIRSAVLPG